MRKTIFLVDADDTILDFHGVASQAVRYALTESGIEWQEWYAEAYATLNTELWAALERKTITRATLMETRFPLFLQRIGKSEADGARCNRIYTEYLSTKPKFLDGAIVFLQALRERGKIYIVTNGTSYVQEPRFRICKLDAYVDGIFVSESIGWDKPAKEFSDYVYANIPNFDKENAVWIGDSLSADILCANLAKTDSIWFNPHGKPLSGVAQPTYTAKNYAKILEILDRI